MALDCFLSYVYESDRAIGVKCWLALHCRLALCSQLWPDLVCLAGLRHKYLASDAPHIQLLSVYTSKSGQEEVPETRSCPRYNAVIVISLFSRVVLPVPASN